MRNDPFNLREERDSIDDYNEIQEIRSHAEPASEVNPVTGEPWSDYYQRIYRQENESRARWAAEHPEIAAEIEAKRRAEGLDKDADQGLMDLLFGGE